MNGQITWIFNAYNILFNATITGTTDYYYFACICWLCEYAHNIYMKASLFVIVYTIEGILIF